MSTFLDLCQQTRQEAGFTGNGPTTVINQQGQYAKIVSWVNRAYLETLTYRQDWDFMWAATTFNTVAAQGVYDLTVNSTHWGQAAIFETALGKTDQAPIDHMIYRDFYSAFLIGSPESGRPTTFTIRPDGELLLYPVPDKVYTFSADYYKQALPMVNNTDVPLIPVQYHSVILYKALAHCTANTEDFSTYQYAERQFDIMVNKMERDQLPAYRTAGPLA